MPAGPDAPATHRLRKAAVAVAGFSVLMAGLALLPVPVPGTTMVLMPLGLTILAREFGWAQRLRDGFAAAARRTWARLRAAFGRSAASPAAVPGS